ncbi:MAG: hypothetical protein GY869_00215 [Planctomycetes bacterium]|nr:hypothetical protein [Planctomycetota bacterium]
MYKDGIYDGPSYFVEEPYPFEYRNIYKYHLENFLATIRSEAELNCPVETGYEALVSALKIQEAVESGERVELSEEDFVVGEV